MTFSLLHENNCNLLQSLGRGKEKVVLCSAWNLSHATSIAHNFPHVQLPMCRGQNTFVSRNPRFYLKGQNKLISWKLDMLHLVSNSLVERKHIFTLVNLQFSTVKLYFMSISIASE